MEVYKQTSFYRGKVRDVYGVGDQYLLMLASNRISAFDVVLPRPIPYKGQVLNQMAIHFLEATRDLVPNWFIASPTPQTSVGFKCEPFAVEMVIRGHLSGHAWRTYSSGNYTLCGVTMPEGLKESDAFLTPLITPSTKAKEGHDEDISREEIISRGIVSEEDYCILEDYTRKLFARGQAMARERGLILVDTKYEFGKRNGQIYLIDEIHTPDSSRYFMADGFEERQAAGEKQQQLSKEFVREWLIEHEFMGKAGQAIPEMDDDFVDMVSDRYIALYERMTGKEFHRENLGEREIEERVNLYLESLLAS